MSKRENPFWGDQFYPTPRAVAVKMLAKISKEAEHFLEPSAGKGDLAEAIAQRHKYHDTWDKDSLHKTVDCIEINPELQAILRSNSFQVVGRDWLTYDGVCYYDALLMNPPFINGDDHLLKAWDFLHDGEIVCLLDEETIKNPHTKARQRLAGIIRDHGSVEYLGACFSKAQRNSDVKVAMVYLRKVSEDDRAELWGIKTEEQEPDGKIDSNESMLAVIDQLGNMQHYYDMANTHVEKAITHLRKATEFLKANGIYIDDKYKNAVHIGLANMNNARADFARIHRRDAWKRVFDKMDFHRWLDKKQQEQFIRDIERDSTIPFTKENIRGTLENVFQQRERLFQQSCANVFDELTSYYKGNGNHTEGWKTNDSYKVNEKLIFPWGCSFDSKYFNKFELSYTSGMIDIYNDLDRVLCVLDGQRFEECFTVGSALRHKFDRIGGKYDHGTGYSTSDNRCSSAFFDIKFWKKGTVHLRFRDKRILDAFNIAASAGKRWLGERTQDDDREPQWNPAPHVEERGEQPEPIPEPEIKDELEEVSEVGIMHLPSMELHDPQNHDPGTEPMHQDELFGGEP